MYSNDGKQIASCSQDQLIYVWAVDSGQMIQELAGHEHVVEQVRYVPEQGGKGIMKTQQQNGQPLNVLVSTSRDKEIRVWNTILGSCLFVLSGHDNWVNGVAFHPDGVHMYSVSDDKTVRVRVE